MSGVLEGWSARGLEGWRGSDNDNDNDNDASQSVFCNS